MTKYLRIEEDVYKDLLYDRVALYVMQEDFKGTHWWDNFFWRVQRV